jgi:Flp pilus assembly protein TadB
VPVASFLLYSLIWAAAGAAIMWIATGGYTIMPIVGGVGGIFLYSQYLIARRDDHMVRYEESIADLGDRLAIAASIKGTLEPSLKECIKILPEIIKPDIEEVVRDIESGTPTLDALERLREKRRFAMMETLIESIRLWRTKASDVPLSRILSPVSTSLRRQAFTRQQETDKMGRVRNSLYVAVFGPPAIIFIFRLLNPSLSRYFETLEGELLLFISAFICLVIYYQGTRWLAAHRETVKFES